MPKTKISEFDVDPANNTDINSINIAEGCAPSGINNAIRQLMSDLKEFQTGAGGDPFNGAVNGTVGATTPNTGAFTTLSASGAFSANGGATLGDASGDALTINSSAVSIPNGLNFDSNTFVIDATNNNVGIGTSSPQNNSTFTTLTVDGTNSIIEMRRSGSRTGRFYVDSTGTTIGAYTATPLMFITNDTERMRIDSSGNLLVGTTTIDPTFNRVNGLQITPAGSIFARANNPWDLGRSVTSGIHISFYTDNGSARVTAGNISSNGSTTTYATSSDYRMKTDVQPMTNALNKVMQLNPVTYKWVNGLGGTKENGEGFIAHELQEVVPDCVTGEKDAVDAEGNPVYQGIDTSFLVATLTASIQELKAIVDAQAERIAVLESK